ncbi:small heat shock protein, chloroplastic-like [Panicum miliaceum]|uniref:Small heat shock protein, chloroplastic-like n=1 Tax=Panicum miliaceum TaxID=4540 RepID=A0A3L6RFR1_PANMI|nr:small heat shock protein, chloroplastic-like [Panicum miliaceum]
MQQAVASNLHGITTSPAAPRSRFTWTISPCSVVVPKRSSVKVRSMRNGSTDSLDHLQRASKPRQQQHGSAPSPRRRLIQTTPFGLLDSFPEARTLDQMVRTMERIMDGEGDDDGRVLVVPADAVPRADAHNGVAVPAAAAARRRGGRTPWEVRERAGEYLVRFDMPGMTREDVRVSVRDRTLVVAAEKAAAAAKELHENDEEEEEEEGEPWPAASFGRYRTRFELPENVDVERIAAEVKDGVLYLTIPKLSAGGKVVNIQVQ